VSGGAAGTEPAVVVDGLVKRYAGRAVVDGVSMTVARGELVAVLGPNGAGKTTTVEIVEGYRARDGGRVSVLGADPGDGGPALRARVGLMLQGGGIDPRARPRETLRQYARFHAAPRDPDELLALMGLESVADTRYRRLSGGERQRLGFALALVGRPEVVILDEPTAGMDPEARAQVRSVVAGLRDDGLAVLLTSHDLTDVERLADRIVVLDHGRVVAAGTPAELAAGAASRLRIRLDRALRDDELAELSQAVGATLVGATAVADGDGARYRVDGVSPDAALVAAVAIWCATAGHLILELRAGGGSLEDVYLGLVGASQPAATDTDEAATDPADSGDVGTGTASADAADTDAAT
jgi:ABC-2 type transport system ATP-binding protein